MTKNNVSTVSVIIAIVLAIFCVGLLYINGQKVSQDDVESQIETLTSELNTDHDSVVSELTVSNKLQVAELETKNTELEFEVTTISDELTASKGVLETIQTELDSLKETKNTEMDVRPGHSEDELVFGDQVVFDVSDRQVSTLLDTEIDFDDEDYDVEETLAFDVVVGINGEEYNEDVYVELKKEGIVYTFLFDADLEIDDITIDEPLEFVLLGETVELSEWDKDEITFTKGNTFLAKEKEVLIVEDKTVELVIVNDDYVYVLVTDLNDNTDSQKIYEGITEDVLGLDIYVESVLDNEADEGTFDLAVLKIGSEVEVVVEDGDWYDEDVELWKWVIGPNTIGLELARDFDELDEDEQPLAIGEQLCIPNDYVCFEFTGVSDEDVEDYTFEYDEDDNVIEATGKFIFDDEEYDEIYFDNNDIYDADEEVIITSAGEIELGETEMVLQLAGTKLSFQLTDGIEEIRFINKIKKVQVDGDTINQDENYRTVYGAVIYDSENAIEDQEATVDIPEARLEAEVTVLG